MIPTYVVIPVKDQRHYTEALVCELLDQGEAEQILVFDNGSTDGTPDWLNDTMATSYGRLDWFDAEGLGISAMWNLGLDFVHLMAGGEPHNIALLNNDLAIAPKFLGALSAGLRFDSCVGVAGANYDARSFSGAVQPTRSLCGGLYDGTGGLPGFAFMVRGEEGYRFPKELTWWYGDGDLLHTVLASGRLAVLVRDAVCVHLDGGGRTGDWASPEMQAVLRSDRAAFDARWRR